MPNPQKEFRKAFRGTNFMTPEVECYGRGNGVAFELSSGSGLFDAKTRIYGVTFLRGGKRMDPDESAGGGSLGETLTLIAKVCGPRAANAALRRLLITERELVALLTDFADIIPIR